jgi:hypothetical protein
MTHRVTLTPIDTRSNALVTTRVALTIHFLEPKVVVVNKIVVATGTMAALNACSSLLHFRLEWDPNARF